MLVGFCNDGFPEITNRVAIYKLYHVTPVHASTIRPPLQAKAKKVLLCSKLSHKISCI
jgi:hypothetical protein